MSRIPNLNKFNVNVGAKEILAKLMATENIVIEHKQVSTASFDVKNRVLTLPIFKEGLSADLYSMFIGHEVGHALFTPWAEVQQYLGEDKRHLKAICQIVEDTRVDRKITTKFPGLRRCYREAFEELVNSDKLPEPDDHYFDKLNLVDRIMFHNVFDNYMYTEPIVPFLPEELKYVNMVEACETFYDVVQAAQAIYDYLSEEQRKQLAEREAAFGAEQGEGDGEEIEVEVKIKKGKGKKKNKKGGQKFPKNAKLKVTKVTEEDADEEGDETSDAEGDQAGDGEEESNEDGLKVTASGQNDDGEDTDTDGAGDEGNGESGDEEDANGTPTIHLSQNKDKYLPASKTSVGPQPLGDTNTIQPQMTHLREQMMRDETDQSGVDYLYLTLGTAPIDEIIVPKDVVQNVLTTFYTNTKNPNTNQSLRSVAEKKFEQFRQQQSVVVNYMVKEFEMRKAALQSAYQQTANTGLLDLNKAYSYRYNEDLFLTKTTVTGSKSHGLVMFIDLSSSMSSNIAGTIEQLLNLVWFCRKVQIPFLVYGFLPHSPYGSYHPRRLGGDRFAKPNMLGIPDGFILKEYFSHKMNTAEFRTACLNLYSVSMAYSGQFRDQGVYSDVPDAERLANSTPLDETVISAIEIVKRFRKANNLDIVNTVFLTDGEGNSSLMYRDPVHGRANLYHGTANKKVFVRVPGTTKTYSVIAYQRNIAQIFQEMLRDVGRVNIIGFYIASGARNVLSSLFQLNQQKVSQLEKEFSTNGNVTVSNCGGYDDFHIICRDQMKIKDRSLELNAGASESQIAEAFKVSYGHRAKNRVLLSKFIQKIATQQR